MRYLLLALLTLPLLTLPDRTLERSTTAPAPRYSAEDLGRIRGALLAQIAVREADAAVAVGALSGEHAVQYQATSLAGGGVALRAHVSQFQASVARRDADGRVQITDGSLAGSGEGRHAR